MRLFLKLLLVFMLAVPVIAAGALLLAGDNHPAIDRTAEITPQNIERAKRILDNNDQRKLKSGAQRTILLSQADLDLAANYLTHRYARGSARVVLEGGSAQIEASAHLPENPIGRFINAETLLTQNGALPRIEHLRIGGLSLPGWLADWLLGQSLTRALGEENYRALINTVKKVNFGNRIVAITYDL